MKIGFLLFLMAITGLSIQATSSAVAFDQGPSEAPVHVRSGRKQNSDPVLLADDSILRRQGSGSSSKNGNHVPVNRERTAPARAMHPSGATRTSGVTKEAFTRHEAAIGNLPMRSPTVVSPTLPSLGNARHRGANPPTLGGPLNLNTGKSGAINGTSMRRRP